MVVLFEKKYNANDQGIRQCRQDIFNFPSDSLLWQVSKSIDFFTMSSCRDLIFHTEEHCFTLDVISLIVNNLNLNFLGFNLLDKNLLQQYHKQFPSDYKGINFKNWALFDKEHPQTFLGMYQFWVQKLY